jgi:hypothetical protein
MPLALAQNDENRLLPQSYVRTIETRWTQDGRVVDLELEFPKSEFVVVELIFEVNYKPCRTLLSIIGGYHDPACPVNPERHTLKIEAQPGSSVKKYLELKFKETLTDVNITDARSRPMTMLERLTAKFR